MQSCVYHHCATNNTEGSKVAELSLCLTKSCFVLCFQKWNRRWTQTWQTNGSDLHKMETQLFSVQANQDSDWPQEGCSCDYCTLTMHWQPHVQVFSNNLVHFFWRTDSIVKNCLKRCGLPQQLFIGNVWTKGNRNAFANTKRHYKTESSYLPSSIKVATIKSKQRTEKVVK
jgi:hypothetical protein